MLILSTEPRAPEDVGFDFTRRSEITADSFLNWVRGAFEGAKGDAWQDFFEGSTRRIGMFLRNAVIYNYPGGMVQFYKDEGVIPQTSVTSATKTSTGYSVRSVPQELSVTEIGSTSDPEFPNTVEIYGWLDAGGTLSDGVSTYWLLVVDQENRLVWVASNGLQHNPSALNQQNQITTTIMNPSRNYAATDLPMIVGE
ncbi:MAG: hypothetical protein HXY41_07960 [Chloroflexi bacterium]|nr:hypothetical protein [Chloroflexota bacterium]